MHWTTLSDLEIFATNDVSREREMSWQEERLSGQARICITRYRDGRAVVDRLISPVPADYLNPRWQPGTVFYD